LANVLGNLTLRKRTLLALALPMGLFIAGLYAMASLVLLSSFAGVEERDARLNVARCVGKAEQHLIELQSMVHNWSRQDEVRELIESPGAPGAEQLKARWNRRATDSSLSLLVADDQGRVLYTRGFGESESAESKNDAPPEWLTKLLRWGSGSSFGLLNGAHSQTPSRGGLIMLGAQPMLVATYPVMSAGPEGRPLGLMMLGRRLSEQQLSELSAASGITLQLLPVVHGQALAVPGVRRLGGPVESHAWWLDEVNVTVSQTDEKHTVSRAVVADLFGRPALEVLVRQPRTIYVYAVVARDALMWATVAISAIFLALLMRVLGIAVLGPVQRLSEEVEQVGSDGKLTARVSAGGAREVANLASEINRLIEAAGSAKRAAEEASAAKTQFLANTSHEIRTPLNGVMGALDLLQRGALDEKQRRHVRMARFSCESLLHLINDILDLSKIEAKAVELERIDLDVRAVVEDVAELCAQRASEKGVKLNTRVHPSLRCELVGDPLRLRQVLLNLASNAVKFTEKGAVTVSATVDRVERDALVARFTVNDTGCGIPPDRVERLFRTFSQVDASTTRKHGGTGLGLSISRQLVELMGGNIGVVSEPGRGSTFWFTVPLSRAGAGGAGGAKGKASPAQTLGINDDIRQMRILVACPPGELRDRLQGTIKGWGMHSLVADAPSDVTRAMDEWGAIGQPVGIVLAWAGFEQDGLLTLADAIFTDVTRQRAGPVLVGEPALRGQIDAERLHAAGWVDAPCTPSHLLDAIVDATVYVRSPNRSEEQGARAAEQGAPDTPQAATRGARLLLVEDNEINQAIATELLVELGYRVAVSPHGQDAVQQLLAKPFDLVLMDCQMPVMDGFEATRRVRQLETAGTLIDPRASAEGAARARAKPLPIIALTANALEADRDKCLRSGMDAFLTKPLEPAKLVAAIEKLLTERGLRVHPGGAAAMRGEPAVDVPSTEAPAPAAVAKPAKVAPAAPVDDTPVLDREALLRRCMNKQTLADTMLAKFTQGVPAQVMDLSEAVDNLDFARCATMAHALSGSAANMGATRASAAARALEQASHAHDAEAVRLARSRLLVELRRVVDEVASPATAKSPAP
jgi:signal transduction histidine kinase/CheY-like chemotaxis protein/HPt (histidine-containing phosphotransfer) domain-containing protein